MSSSVSIVSKIFNVHPGEWPRILVSWLLKFVYRAAFVIGWTIIVALFTGRYGINSLPFLFILNGFFTIFGTFLYSSFLDRIRTERLMFYTILFSCVSLLFAIGVYSFSLIAFFFFLILAEAVFLNQFRLLIDGYVEKMFSPLESERAFPLIESSLTLGGIVAGLVLVYFPDVEVYKFVYFWIILLLFLFPVLKLYHSFFSRMNLLCKKTFNREAVSVFSKFKNNFLKSSNLSFLKGLFLIVLLQWILYNLLEFQYTKAVFQNVSAVVLDAGSGFEHAFIHDLGTLFILFSFTGLIVQFFVGGRLINSLGVIGSMLVHPLVTLLGVFGLTFRFGFYSAVLAKNNFTITSVLQNNAYHSAYYAIPEKSREHTRELLEGIVRPVGAIFGPLIIFSLQLIFADSSLIFAINVSMLAVALLLFFVTFLQQRIYTRTAFNDLLSGETKRERFNAIDILSQKGHKGATSLLLKILSTQGEQIAIKIRVIKALVELNCYDLLPRLVRILETDDSPLCEEAIDAILAFNKLPNYLRKHLYFRIRLIRVLKALYTSSKSERIRVKVMNALTLLSRAGTIDFLVELLDDESEVLKPEIIHVLGNYRDESLVDLLVPYLRSKNPNIQINAAIALGRLKKFLFLAVSHVNDFAKSNDSKKLSLALYAMGELKLKYKRKFCLLHLYSSDVDIKTSAALALAKMGYFDSLPVLIDLLFSGPKVLSRKIKTSLRNIDVRVYKNIDKIIKQIVADRVENMFGGNTERDYHDFDFERLSDLKWLYCLAEEYDEVESINNILKS